MSIFPITQCLTTVDSWNHQHVPISVSASFVREMVLDPKKGTYRMRYNKYECECEGVCVWVCVYKNSITDKLTTSWVSGQAQLSSVTLGFIQWHCKVLLHTHEPSHTQYTHTHTHTHTHTLDHRLRLCMHCAVNCKNAHTNKLPTVTSSKYINKNILQNSLKLLQCTYNNQATTSYIKGG